MNKKAIAGLLGAASLVTLAACNNNKANNAGGESAAKASERKFPTEVTNEGTVVKRVESSTMQSYLLHHLKG